MYVVLAVTVIKTWAGELTVVNQYACIMRSDNLSVIYRVSKLKVHGDSICRCSFF